MRANSWALIFTPKRVELHAGSHVEVDETFIAEGAWSGAFDADGLRRSTFRCGSGAVFTPDEVILCAPTHSVEPIYCFKNSDQLIASNSLHLIVAIQPKAAPPSLSAARESARTLQNGRSQYSRALYETSAGVMMRFAFTSVRISRAGLDLAEEPAGEAAKFNGYDGYLDNLLSTLRSLTDNARDAKRSFRYGSLVTTVSGGYDSTACAALAQQLGAQEAVTLATARGNVADSGAATAAALGLACHAYERFGLGLDEPGGAGGFDSLYLDARHLQAEHRDFLASIATAEDLFFASFEPHLSGNIVLTGFHGDKAWDMHCTSGPDIKRGDTSGSGLDEFRKRVGFVHVPVPFIGVDNHVELARINNSEEMRDFRIGGPYDRPLPRRIAEDAGVPRHVFGMKKAAGSVMIKNGLELRAAAFDALVNEYRLSLAAEQRSSIA